MNLLFEPEWAIEDVSIEKNQFDLQKDENGSREAREGVTWKSYFRWVSVGFEI